MHRGFACVSPPPRRADPEQGKTPAEISSASRGGLRAAAPGAVRARLRREGRREGGRWGEGSGLGARRRPGVPLRRFL